MMVPPTILDKSYSSQLLYRYNLKTFERQFGTWGTFLESMGEPKTRRDDVSDQELISAYFRHKSELIKNGILPKLPISLMHKSPLDSRLMVKKYGAIFGRTRYLRRWGSWTAFLVHIKEKQTLRDGFEDLAKSEYFRLKQLLGRRPRPMDFIKTIHGKPNQRLSDTLPKLHLTSINRLFGNYDNFLKEIGEYDPEDNRLTMDMKKALTENYFKVKEKLGRRPTVVELTDKSLSKWGDGAICCHFGNYTKFLIAIGEVPKGTKHYSRIIRWGHRSK